MSRSSPPNLRNAYNFIASLERNMITNVPMRTHDAIVIAVDLFSAAGVVRLLSVDEGIHMSRRGSA
jgi:hypothetical protein